MISQAGDTHFLIRTQAKYRDLIEANIYAQYPEAEISQVADYVDSVPADIPDKDYNLWGTELIFIQDDAYPIRTYPTFEKDAAVEEKRIDPLASLLEIMSKLQEGEQVWIQALIRPVPDDWKKKGEEIRDELVGREKKKKESELKKEVVAWKDVSKAVAHQLVTGKPLEEAGGENKKDGLDTLFLWKATKAEQEIIHAIEQKLSKIGYEVIIRLIYLARRDVYRDSPMRKAIIGCYKQFNTQHLNGFRPNPKVTPFIDYKIQLREPRNLYRKRRVFTDYRKRLFVQHSKVTKYLHPLIFERLPILRWFFIRSEPIILNIEELASIFHFPAITVKAPLTPKVESRKSKPPIGLPVE
jgi:hypothetical protein